MRWRNIVCCGYKDEQRSWPISTKPHGAKSLAPSKASSNTRVPTAGGALLPALLMLFELLMAVFMDKRALNNVRKSSQVSSQTGKDDSVEPRPMGANTDTTTAPTPARRYGVPILPLGCSATIDQREARSAPAIFRRAVPVRLPRRDPHKVEPLAAMIAAASLSPPVRSGPLTSCMARVWPFTTSTSRSKDVCAPTAKWFRVSPGVDF